MKINPYLMDFISIEGIIGSTAIILSYKFNFIMANVNELIDHLNVTLRSKYKEGVWVKVLVARMALDERDVLLVEGLDFKKFQQGKPEARIVLRAMPDKHNDVLIHMSDYVDALHSERVVDVAEGDVAIYFKISPMLHWQGEFMPLIREVGASDVEAKSFNLRTGLKIGIENAIAGLPERCGKDWVDEDNEKLIHYYNKEFGVEAISVILKRTPIAVVDQLIKLGVLKGSQAWSIRNSFIDRYDTAV